MAKTDKIRVHLVLPEKEDEQEDKEAETVGVCPECGGELVAETHLSLGEALCADCRLVSEVDIDDEAVSHTDHLTSEFRDRFHLAYERFSEYVGVLEGTTFLSTEILEDRPDQREDIGEVYELTKEAFPGADVLLTEQYSPRNRNDEEFLAYSYDIIIRACNTNPDAPTITQQIELTDAKVGGSNYPYRHGKYIISTEDSNLAALDLNEGIESWRQDLRYDKLSKNYGFEKGIVQTKRKPPNTLFLVSWEDGTIEWVNEDVTDGEEEYIRTWEPAISDQTIYAGSDEGTIYRVDVRDGTVEEIANLDGEIRAIKYDSNLLYATTATERRKEEDGEDDWGGSRKSYDFSLISLTNGDIKWKTDFDEAGRETPRPYITSKTIVTEINDELKAYNREQGNERWSLAKEDFESNLGSEESEEPDWASSYSRSFDLKILDSIGDTICCVARLSGGCLAAIDGKTGDIEWVNQEYNTTPYNTGVIHEHNGKLVFNHRDNDFLTSFVALNSESGAEEWQFETPGRTGGGRSIGSEFVFITSEDCIAFENNRPYTE